ncbi:hypothetical protein HYALB_00012946 [Hymenoscyphus albidus]|uniref:Fe2OG dioxygenase domain-containing protein n=1 Tax=Hymenoscyphus albidus TaxID=595503 RepID=A0A9N9LVV2_9HELO|nr:hypothetical protein HYALB_00012946 [Hymenoscyphus albidus]
MSEQKYLDRCAAFPHNVSCADIPTVSFNQLLEGNENESEKLYDACRKHGFFLLDLRDTTDGERLLEDAEMMFGINEATLSLDSETLEKYKFNPPESLTGYKSAGQIKTDDGYMDTTEMYNISQDDILHTSGSKHDNPQTIEIKRDQCRDFFNHAYAAIVVIFSHLDKRLGLSPGTLASLCPQTELSHTSLRMLLTLPSSDASASPVTLGGHTDIGTITMIFTTAGGLQVLPAGAENVNDNWKFIRLQPKCAVINIGDTLVEWTGGLLRSSLHRVAKVPGKQNESSRLSLDYLVRPNSRGSMGRLKSNGIIPALAEGEEEETRSVDEWAAWRVKEIMSDIIKQQTRGGIAVYLSSCSRNHGILKNRRTQGLKNVYCAKLFLGEFPT